MPEIDKPILDLLKEMGFVPSTKSPKLYEIEIKDGFAYVDFRKVDGRRFAMVKGKPVDDEDSIPILKAFKERRDKIKASQSSQKEKDGKEVYDTTKGEDSKDEHILNHAARSGQSGESLKKSPQDSQLPKGDTGQDKQPIPPSTMVSNPSMKSSEPAPVGGKTVLKSSNTTTSTDVKDAAPPTPIKEQQPNPPAASQSPNLYEFFFELVEEGGIIELFADTGFLKTTTCVKTVCDAVSKGKKAFVIDTEGKAGLHNKRMLKAINSYSYLPIWNDIVKAVESLGKYDLLIIDSIGFPISAKASGMDMHEQGKAWNQMMSLIGDTAKAWAFKNNAIVLFTNQPKSEMMKSEEELKRLNAVGDKVHFAPTIILKAVDKAKVPGHFDAKTGKTSLPETVVTLLSHRNPDFMDDTIMVKIYKQDENVHIEIPENVRERLKKLKE